MKRFLFLFLLITGINTIASVPFFGNDNAKPKNDLNGQLLDAITQWDPELVTELLAKGASPIATATYKKRITDYASERKRKKETRVLTNNPLGQAHFIKQCAHKPYYVICPERAQKIVSLLEAAAARQTDSETIKRLSACKPNYASKYPFTIWWNVVLPVVRLVERKIIYT